MQLITKQTGIIALLVLLMVVTRYNHFGSSMSLPDATLAIFLLAGATLARNRLSLPVFVLLILEAGGIDYYATRMAGVSDWCITPAYWFLIPTYAIMWFAGYWLAAHLKNSWRGVILFGGVSWLATTIAFLLSNTSFFLLSGYFGEMNIAEYAARVSQYYPPYLIGSLMYLALASVIYISLTSLSKSRASA